MCNFEVEHWDDGAYWQGLTVRCRDAIIHVLKDGGDNSAL
jgi:hypothetical protein